MSDFWEMLEIEPTTDVSAIKGAYAALAKKYHPEQHPKEFLKLRNAYEAAMDYASSGTILFSVENAMSSMADEIETGKQNNERNESRATQTEYWDLSNFNETSASDCTEAISQFLDLYQSGKRNDAKQWYLYFTSASFLDVWREEVFTKMMWEIVLENIDKYPVNKTFAKCLNAVYGCFVHAPHSFREVQYERDFLFDGFSNIEKILELNPRIFSFFVPSYYKYNEYYIYLTKNQLL